MKGNDERTELLSLEGTKEDKVLSSENCVPVRVNDCLTLELINEGHSVSGTVQIIWAGKTIYDQKKSFTSDPKKFHSMNDRFSLIQRVLVCFLEQHSRLSHCL